MKVFVAICRGILTLVFHSFLRVTYHNKENVPAQGPVVFVSNHESMIDPILITYGTRIYISWMAKAELFDNKLLSRFFRMMKAIPVKRGVVDYKASKQVFQILRDKGAVGIFLQGTRSRGKFREVKAHHGAVKFAHEANAFIIPVTIAGRIRLFGKVHVSYGTPVKIPDKAESEKYSKLEYKEMAQDILNRIYDTAEELYPDMKLQNNGNTKS